MENLSPSRIQPLAPGEEKASDDPRPRKPHPKAPPATPATTLPAVDIDADETLEHQLDERA
jgi:hypothetical protein